MTEKRGNFSIADYSITFRLRAVSSVSEQEEIVSRFDVAHDMKLGVSYRRYDFWNHARRRVFYELLIYLPNQLHNNLHPMMICAKIKDAVSSKLRFKDKDGGSTLTTPILGFVTSQPEDRKSPARKFVVSLCFSTPNNTSSELHTVCYFIQERVRALATVLGYFTSHMIILRESQKALIPVVYNYCRVIGDEAFFSSTYEDILPETASKRFQKYVTAHRNRMRRVGLISDIDDLSKVVRIAPAVVQVASKSIPAKVDQIEDVSDQQSIVDTVDVQKSESTRMTRSKIQLTPEQKKVRDGIQIEFNELMTHSPKQPTYVGDPKLDEKIRIRHEKKVAAWDKKVAQFRIDAVRRVTGMEVKDNG